MVLAAPLVNVLEIQTVLYQLRWGIVVMAEHPQDAAADLEEFRTRKPKQPLFIFLCSFKRLLVRFVEKLFVAKLFKLLNKNC